jgi:selenocysteine lyase/cysteine desulfurase
MRFPIGGRARGRRRPEGGGAIQLVMLDDVIWAEGPELHEAGSPNVVGVVALGAACRRLLALGMDAVAERERELAARLFRGLAGVHGLRMLRLWPAAGTDRVGVAAFNLDGHRHPVAA